VCIKSKGKNQNGGTCFLSIKAETGFVCSFAMKSEKADFPRSTFAF
jgi:hypothetical protein